MSKDSAFRPKPYTVSQINRYIRQMLDEDVLLSSLFIKGEISGCKRHSSGHWYFILKDAFAAVNTVMFRTNAAELSFVPKDGLNVIIFGRISLYEKTGQYQFYAECIEPLGKGSLYAAFEQLKKKLSTEGLFDVEHKKKLPFSPNTIAVVTSETGDAVRDIINVIKRRAANTKIIVVPTLVQGENAAKNIVEAIETVNKWGKADIMIIGRGGGSIEDLWAFNEEIVARAIFDSKIPIISAVGHETDFTIADFAADVRAATPSVAAELAVPDMMEEKRRFDKLYISLNREITNSLASHRLECDRLNSQLDKEIDRTIDFRKSELLHNIDRLSALSPLNVLKRGYAVVNLEKDNNVVIASSQVQDGDMLQIALHDGSIQARAVIKP